MSFSACYWLQFWMFYRQYQTPPNYCSCTASRRSRANIWTPRLKICTYHCPAMCARLQICFLSEWAFLRAIYCDCEYFRQHQTPTIIAVARQVVGDHVWIFERHACKIVRVLIVLRCVLVWSDRGVGRWGFSPCYLLQFEFIRWHQTHTQLLQSHGMKETRM